MECVTTDRLTWGRGTRRTQTAARFIRKVLDKEFESADALRMIQEKHTIDFGSARAGCTQARPSDSFFPQFFLDFFSVVGKPGRPISRPDGPIFDNITVSFQRWSAPYGAKHVSGIPFNITGRTFRVAQAATREIWFIVMHPVTGEMSELPASAAEARRRREKAGERSGMPMPLACELASYITGVFQSPTLLGEGVQPSWRPGGRESQRISSSRWMTFQELFMEGWAAWSGRRGAGSFWAKHEPAFHAYDYGANIEIEVSEELYDLPRERHRPMDEDDGDNDDDDETLPLQELSITDDGPRQARADTTNEARADGSDGGRIDSRHYSRILRQSKGLYKLVSELEARFQLEGITAISYALAVCINSDRTTRCEGEAERSETRCLLADRNMLAREFPTGRDFTFYPQAFHPVYGNVSSSRPPMFLDSLFAAMKGNMSHQNEGADVLSFGYFQGYSNTKRSVRHSPHDLLATKGYATAALTVPTSDARATSAAREKRERLLRILRGPSDSKPFARERHQIGVAIEGEEVAFRIEQVVSLDVRNMVARERTFEAVIRPIFQMMRFFLVEHESFVHIFRSIPLEIFPRIMCAYSRLFELALGEMERAFVLGGEQGLDVARSEAVAVIDRLGGYVFSGHPRHLPRTVLRPLGTFDSLWAGAWPFLDPAVLNLGASGSGGATIDMTRWPHSARTGRPVLLHVRELHHHYGPRVASSRESAVWFGQLGETAFTSKTAITTFAEELVRELWIPQTKAFIIQQLRRRLHEGGGEDAGKPITMDEIATCEEAMATWEAATDAFTWNALQRLWLGMECGGKRVAMTMSRRRTRQDFAAELVRVIGSEKEGGVDAVSPKSATWPSTLRFAIANGRRSRSVIDAATWAGVITGCLLNARIEWVPDSARGRLTSRSVVRLGGRPILDPIPAGPPGSLRRAAQEAEIRHNASLRERALHQQQYTRISFGCPTPFTSIPNLIAAGFEQARVTFSANGDAKVLDHYQLAMNCLAENIDDPLCQLMLMMALTVCASAETPQVAQGERAFSTSPRRKDPGQLALVMVTRMLWFLYPKAFPWAKKAGGTAYDVAEMTKKIEHKGCSNRMLRELGWVISTSNRDSPRNTDLHLRPREELLGILRELSSALRRPEDFISTVFHSRDRIWVERCASIIKQGVRGVSE
ncbi:hypothetical protein CLIM01_14476 [Colletotrichum limetticola]|uniref:Uncharacterized protein n=1 Tax=Colletotrichum limetticola TaxID=1209924 RepID=A0ABQ9P7U7_9PEZI|nr:hypothetical protein CLIM01_14476 [Colletotrichum limetticola]